MEASGGGWAYLWEFTVKQGIGSHSFVRPDTNLFTSGMKSHLFAGIIFILKDTILSYWGLLRENLLQMASSHGDTWLNTNPKSKVSERAL